MIAVIGYVVLGAMALVIGACAFSPFVLSGRIAEQEERCPGDLRDCPEMCHECEGLVDYELETYRALSPIEAKAKEAAEVLEGVPL